MRSPDVIDGFWLPRAARDQVLSTGTTWQSMSFARGRECGRECDADSPGAVTARWPELAVDNLAAVIDCLALARRSAPRGVEFWDRLQAAILQAAQGFLDGGGDRIDAGGGRLDAVIDAISSYTGYSPPMVAATLHSPDMWDLAQMKQALTIAPTRAAAARWELLPGLPGRLRFFPDGPVEHVPGLGRAFSWLSRLRDLSSGQPLFAPPEPPGFVTGYGAGNVPGTALMIALLALSTTLAGEAPPVVIVRNSRREPIFSPLVFGALERADPALVGTVAILTWDYRDVKLQDYLLSRSDLVIAAAGDEAIDHIAGRIAALRRGFTAPDASAEKSPRAAATANRDALGGRPEKLPTPSGSTPLQRPRFHPHGHKVSFTAIGREMLDSGRQTALPGKRPLLDVVALLAGLDSVFWDQNGCLSSRMHFVERGGPADLTVLDYAERLTQGLRFWSRTLPRGAWPLRPLRDAFDRYKALEGMTAPEGPAGDGGVRVLSDHADDFVVVLDQRALDKPRLNTVSLSALVNDAQSRVVVVRPLDDLMELPHTYLNLLPPRSLQSLSVAVGKPGEGSTPEFLEFAAACGARGVTAIRVVGRGAFPQLAYSWDGLLPLDLLSRRPPGHFTTIEFDAPFDALGDAAKALTERPD